MRTLVAGAGVVAQLGVFALAMWLNSEYGHETGKAAALNVLSGAQMLISMLFLAAATEQDGDKRSAFKACLFVILIVYHTFMLPVGVGSIAASSRTLAWEGAIGGSLVIFNLLAFYYTVAKGGTAGILPTTISDNNARLAL